MTKKYPSMLDDVFGETLLEPVSTPNSEWASASKSIDLRRHQRVASSFVGKLTTEWGSVKGVVTNLSRGGLRFESLSELPEQFRECADSGCQSPMVLVDVSFYIDDQEGVAGLVVAQARIAFALRAEDASYKFGLEFKYFAEGEENAISFLRARGA